MREFNGLPASARIGLRLSVATSGMALALAFASTAALAQATPGDANQLGADHAKTDQAAADAQTRQDQTEIVVTGTSLRGVAPAGAETIKLNSADIQASGATSTQALLADIPQLNSFASIPYAGIGGTQLTVNRVNLRNLPQGTGGGSPTLVLIDGHRFVGDGVKQTVPDPGVIPPGMIDHVEVVLDGGSAVYGADAVGGVINFITKHDFDGIQINGTEGLGDKYSTTNVDFLAGRKWDGGGVYIGYSYAYNSPIQNRDRSYEKELDYSTGVARLAGLQCNAGNVQSGGNTYAITGTNPVTLTPGGQNLCDPSKYGEMFPQEIRHSVMGGFHQDLTSSLEFDVKGFYSYRKDTLNSGTQDGFTVTSSSGVTFPYPAPYNTIPVFGTPTLGYTPVTPGSTASQQVSGNFSAVNRNYTPQLTTLKTYGITPTLTWNISHDWHVKAFYNYGHSTTTVHQPTLNSNLLQSDVSAGTFNPYFPTASSNTAQIPALLDYENYGLGISTLNNAKVVVDGSLFHLPGGDIKVAGGGEYIGESYRGIFNATDTTENTVNTALYPLSAYKRHEFSGFGEINLPLFPHFNVDLQERYDHYSDFGGNWAPSVGASFKPLNWVTLRGKYNKAFQAPSPANLAAGAGVATSYPGVYLLFVPDLVNQTGLLGTLGGGGRAGAVANGSQPFLDVSGTNPHLGPQRATTYDLGIDLSPPVVPGLGLHLTYFHIDYKGTISVPPHGFSPTYFSQFQGSYAMNPTYAQVAAILAADGLSATSGSGLNALNGNGVVCNPTTCNLYSISNGLTTNLGGARISGLDIGMDYTQSVSFGSVFASFNGNYLLNYQTSPSPGAAYTANGVGNSDSGALVARFNFTGTVGMTMGQDIRAQIKWNHAGGGAVLGAGLGQTTQAAFNTFDFFARYDISQLHNAPPISLSLGITNMFNQNPPVFYGGNGASNGYAGGTVGRVFQFGASVTF